MMRAEWVAYGRPAAEALRAAIAAAKGSEPLAPVTVIVPSNHVGVATRRLLASGTLGSVSGRGVGLVAVDFLSTSRLAELIAAPLLAGAKRRPISTPVLAAAVRAALAAEPGSFAPVAQHPATEAALVASCRELRDVGPAGLARLGRSSRRSAEVVRIHEAARARLAGDWYDEQDLMATAAEVVRAADGGGDLGPVIVHLPQLLSRPAAELLVALGEKTDVVVLAGTTGDDRADAEVIQSLERLGVSAPRPALGPRPGSEAVAEIVGPERTTVLTASDSDDEIRAVVRAVVDAARAGTPLDRMAILHAGAGPYGRLAHEHLAAAGLRSNGPSVLPLAARTAGRFLLGLLGLPEAGWRRHDVLAWLADAPVLVDGAPAPVDRWEEASRDAGVVGGRAEWDDRLAAEARRLDARAEQVAAEGLDDDVAARIAERAARARRLRELVLELIDAIEGAAEAPRAWDRHAAWARDLLHRMLGTAERRRRTWPEAEQKAADRVEAALDRLGALGLVEGPVSLAVFRRTLELELDQDLGRVGRFGDGILVGPITMGIGLDLDLVLVVGLAEGTFPALVHDDSLLPDRDREATGDDLPLRRSQVDRQHRQFLAALAAAPAHRLTFPRGDLRRSVERVPSRWLLDVASALAGERLWSPDLAEIDAPWVARIGSFDAGLRRLSFPATAQEHRLRTLLSAADAGERISDPADPTLASGAAMIRGRHSPHFTRFDGNVTGIDLPSPVDQIMSATGLEKWARCPQAYFQERVLGVREPEDPEDSLRITPMHRGSLVHEALDEFIGGVLGERTDEGPAPDEGWSPVDRQRLVAIAQRKYAEFEAKGQTGRMIFWRRDQADITNDLMRFLQADSIQRLNTRSRPLAAELRFGFDPDGLGPVEMPLTDGRHLRFRGSADRVDLAEDGTLYVVDYKTGRATGYTNLSEEQPTLAGSLLQLPIYGQAARAKAGTPDAPVVAEYWFVSAKGDFKRPGYAVTDDVLARVAADLTHVVHGIEAGLFPHHPTNQVGTPFVECAYCDPDGLGAGELRRQWEAKRADPKLAIYADTAEPLAEPVIEGEAIDA